jgi:putative nucleotidyltransferase with HDIG domain
VTSETPPNSPSTSAASPAAIVAALIEEGHRAEVSGRRELARQRYESALYLLRDPSDGPTSAAILRRVGRTYLDDGDVVAGSDCLVAALAVAEACDSLSEVARTVNVMAIGYQQRGLLEDAEPLYHKASRMAREAGDEHLVAMVEQNLGVIASMRGDDATALRHHAASLEKYRTLGLQEELARQLSNIGLAYTGLGRLDEAEAAYEESSTVAQQCGHLMVRLMVEVNRVVLLIARREYDRARVAIDRILKDANEVQDTRILAETFKHSGVIARETGELGEAEKFFKLAYDKAITREDLLLAAEVAREQAELYLVLGRNRDTLQALSLSHGLFTRLRAQRDIADVTRRLRNLEQRFQDLVRKYAQDIESKDAYTLGHCERVADYACAIAVDLGFDETTMFWFRVGALLHDVGKIVVPSDILNKPGALTPEERAWMERHPVAGVEMLSDVEFPGDVIPMIRGHHERWDGHGYPDGLAGEQIPLAARILCVADVYDALTSHRPYRRAFPQDDALRLMAADTGRAFDPDILLRFFRVVPGLAQAVDSSAENGGAHRPFRLTPTPRPALPG